MPDHSAGPTRSEPPTSHSSATLPSPAVLSAFPADDRRSAPDRSTPLERTHVQPAANTASSRPTGGAAHPGAGSAGVAALASSIARGNESAFAALYNARLGAIVALARRWTGRDESFALDVVQETFLRLIARRATLDRFADDDVFDAWLTALARSATIDLLRRECRRTRRERARAVRAGRPASESHRPTDLEAVRRALKAMSEHDRDAVLLRIGGSTLAQIAAVFGLSIGAAHGRIRRGLEAAAKSQRESDHE